MVHRIHDPVSSPRAFCRAGSQSWLLVRWQNRYSYDNAGIVTRFRNMITKPKASMIKFQNLVVVVTV
jgi:hypothetical protein